MRPMIFAPGAVKNPIPCPPRSGAETPGLTLRSRQINRPLPLMAPSTKMALNPTLPEKHDRRRAIRRGAIHGTMRTGVATGDAIDPPCARTSGQ